MYIHNWQEQYSEGKETRKEKEMEIAVLGKT